MKRPTVIFLKFAGALLSILILYVLSYGPVYGYALHSFFTKFSTKTENRLQLAEDVYAPILWISDRNDTIGRLCSRYAFFFANKVYSPRDAVNGLPPRNMESE